MKNFTVPGFVWTAILALIPLLIEWLQGDYFGAQGWVSVTIIVLGFVAKLIEVYRMQSGVTLRGIGGDERSARSRFLWG